MERIKLTVERIKRFTCPPERSQAFLWDDEAKRLAVRVTAAGAKAFVYEGKLDRQTIRRTIGDCAVWTLEDARKEARRLQTMIDKGIDPRELERQNKAEKEAIKTETEAKKKYTLKALLETYADHLEKQKKQKSANAVRSVVKVHILDVDPSLSDKPATTITSNDIAALIRQTREKGKDRTAGILRSAISAAYNAGRRAPFDTDLPSSLIKFKIGSNPVDPIPTIAVNAGNRVLTQEELKNYMTALNDNIIDMALKLALFSGGQRMAQILRAEVTDWNPDTKVLRLFDPKGKRRTPREHLLPLGPEAASIVSELVKRATAKENRWLFPAMIRGKKKEENITTPIHVSVPGPRVTEIAKKIGAGSFDLRDIRRTVETMLAGMGISRDIRAQLLSHGISGVQAQHYDRHEYLKEKHGTLIKWERLLNRIANGEEEKKVIQFDEVR